MCRAPPTTSPLPLARRLRVGSGPILDGHFSPSPALVALIIRDLMATGLAQPLEAGRANVPCFIAQYDHSTVAGFRIRSPTRTRFLLDFNPLGVSW